MAYSRNAVIKQAQAWIGCKESDGSHKKIIDVYNAHSPLARGYKVKYTDAWCATFVSAVAIKCGCTAIIPTECSCNQMIALFQKMGAWQENDAYRPAAGDVIFYDWQDGGTGDNRGSSDHVGIVEKVSGNTITVIEGNKSNAVGRRTLQVNGRYIRGYGIPKYDTAAAGGAGSSGQTGSQAGTAGSAANYQAKINTPKGVNMRSTPCVADGNKIYAIPNGQQVTITRESGSWGYTTYNGRTGWICLDYVAKVSGASSAAQGGAAGYKTGSVYTLQTGMKVRTGPGTNYRAKTHSELTADGKAHDKDKNGCLDAGTRVTCKEVRTYGDSVWLRCPSGWVAAKYGGKTYIR